MQPTDAEAACFEAGIKFGSLYHQFAGTPLSPESADSLARAIEAAIENQPHCEAVTVSIREDELQQAIEAAGANYVELTGRFLDVSVTVAYGGTRVESDMVMEAGYPRMRIVAVEAAE
jgi:hypothetical protein